jgi:thymidylate synthase (FAD)
VFNYIVPPRIRALGESYVKRFEQQMREIQSWYDEWNRLLGESGEASQEDARFVLPNAAETKLMVTMNARELRYFFRLRCCNRAQWEIRGMAIEMLRQVKPIAPTLFENAGPACVTGPCPEGAMSCGKIRSVRRFFKHL